MTSAGPGEKTTTRFDREGNNRGSSSGLKPTTVRRRSPCSHRGYSTKDMCGSSSGGCVKTLASPVHPSMWRSDLGRSGRRSEQFCRRNGSTLMYFFGSPSDPKRAVAQFGSALDWGSRGRRFKSCQPDVLRFPRVYASGLMPRPIGLNIQCERRSDLS